MIEIYLIVSLCMLFPCGIAWLIHSIIEHKHDKEYNEFYEKYAVKKSAEIVYYKKEIMRTKNNSTYHIILQFSDDNDKSYTTSLETNHYSAKKYAKTKSDEFLCLFDAIKADSAFDYFKSINQSSLIGIPLVVLPAEENLVQTGRHNRIMTVICVLSFFVAIGLMLFIGENISDKSLNFIYATAIKISPFVAISIIISRLIFSKINKN